MLLPLLEVETNSHYMSPQKREVSHFFLILPPVFRNKRERHALSQIINTVKP